jgi:hypothetical protein
MPDDCGRNRQHCRAKVFHMCMYHPSGASARHVQRTILGVPHRIFLLGRSPTDNKQDYSAPIGGGVVDYDGETGVAGQSTSTEDAWRGCGLTLGRENFRRCVRTRMLGAGDCGVRHWRAERCCDHEQNNDGNFAFLAIA